MLSFGSDDSDDHERAAVRRPGKAHALRALAGIELEDMGTVFAVFHALAQTVANVFQFCRREPALKEGFLSADLVAQKEFVHLPQAPGAGDVVAHEVEAAGNVFHGGMLRAAPRCGGTASLPSGFFRYPAMRASGVEFGQPHGGVGDAHRCPKFLLTQVAHQLNRSRFGELAGEAGEGAMEGVVR